MFPEEPMTHLSNLIRLPLVPVLLLVGWIQFDLQGAEAEKTLLVLGDSIAAGYGVDATESFPAILQEKLDAANARYEVVNAGLSGDTTSGGLRRMNWLLRRKIDILLIELGGNDGLRGVDPGTTRSNLEKIIDRAQQEYPDILIVLAGMQMPQNMGEEYTAAFQQLFPEVAKARKVHLIPFLLAGVGADPEMNQPDMIHPNPKGHQRVARNVWEILEPLIQPTAALSEDRKSS